MYSEQIRGRLEEKDIEIGDTIKVNDREGRLMPKPESGDPAVVVLKLESGYNVGLEPENIELVEKNESSERERPEIEHDEEKPDILILHTGGTIASRVSYEEGGVKPAFEPEDLLEMYPELAEEVNIHSKVVAQMFSEDMEPGHWQQIAEKIVEEKDDYDGIILGHGTDTMAYTGAALSLMLQNIDTGVMIVGSQRSSDRPSSDAAMNMYCASRFLNETDFTGFGICMHESSSDDYCTILPPQKTRKMHTSRRDAFQAVNQTHLGRVNYETGEVEENFSQKNGEFKKNTELNENVGFLKTRPGMGPEEIEFLIEQGYDGVVLEGTGLGHLPVNNLEDGKTGHHEEILAKLEELAEDTMVVMTSQCIFGRIDMDVYDTGLKIQDAGVISAEDMHPELAYVKMMWVLANSENPEEDFTSNFAGEVTMRSMYDE
ncbi:Glu-tRNA(Gln) amidotransferase subunit GatD [Candidatus Nanohalovita haloferacivicina]|uniref:Glu-tRNA(Gln) amidotransferase subunit GatD n=1 Tax=Candidatus Nanohalovita haloferacivicina TaxID=2978046 RepID=UPI00325FB915|nr:Glutamyl-tRNA(Gln) amidotransferase subunit D [Candidatus Nanohalobia archaeon BNXNv]